MIATESGSTAGKTPNPNYDQVSAGGTQYRSGIYWQNEAERKIVEASRDALRYATIVRFATIHIEPNTMFNNELG